MNLLKKLLPGREETQRREENLLKIISDSGVKIHRLSESQRAKFAKLTENIPKKFESVIGCDVISRTEEILINKYSPSSESKEQILIGIDADLSTSGATAGLAIKRGVEMAVEDINKEGGLFGKSLVMIAKDHATVPSKGIDNINGFYKRDDILAVVGGKHSSVIDSEMKYIQDAKIPYLVPWAAAEEVTENGYEDNYIFRASANDRFISDLLAQHALEHGENIAIIAENSIWGRGNVEKIKTYLDKAGIDTKVSILINKGNNLSSNDILKLKSSKLDVVILVVNPIESSHAMKVFSKNNFDYPIVSHWGFVGSDFYKENAEYINNIKLEFIQNFIFDHSKTKLAKVLKKRYVQKYSIDKDSKIDSQSGIIQAYDLVMMLAQAVKEAGSTDGAKVKEALENLKPYNGALKYYDKAFSKNRHDALGIDDFFFATYNNEGKIVPYEKK